MSEPTTTKPYLLRALYDWCVDNGFTPHVSVRVDPRTQVPMEYVRNGEIVLNIGPLAATRLQMGNEVIQCTVRFSGTPKDLIVPVAAVTSIYARENGHGMAFETERRGTDLDPGDNPPGSPPEPSPPKSGGKPGLRRVK